MQDRSLRLASLFFAVMLLMFTSSPVSGLQKPHEATVTVDKAGMTKGQMKRKAREEALKKIVSEFMAKNNVNPINMMKPAAQEIVGRYKDYISNAMVTEIEFEPDNVTLSVSTYLDEELLLNDIKSKGLVGQDFESIRTYVLQAPFSPEKIRFFDALAARNIENSYPSAQELNDTEEVFYLPPALAFWDLQKIVRDVIVRNAEKAHVTMSHLRTIEGLDTEALVNKAGAEVLEWGAYYKDGRAFSPGVAGMDEFGEFYKSLPSLRRIVIEFDIIRVQRIEDKIQCVVSVVMRHNQELFYENSSAIWNEAIESEGDINRTIERAVSSAAKRACQDGMKELYTRQTAG